MRKCSPQFDGRAYVSAHHAEYKKLSADQGEQK